MAYSSLIYVPIWLLVFVCSTGSDTVTNQAIPGGGSCGCECEYIRSCDAGTDCIEDCCSGTVPNKTIPGQYPVPFSGCNGWPSNENCCCIPPSEHITDALPPFFPQHRDISTMTHEANEDEQDSKPSKMKEYGAEIDMEKKYDAELEKKQEGEPMSSPGKENADNKPEPPTNKQHGVELDNEKQVSEPVFPSQGPILCQ